MCRTISGKGPTFKHELDFFQNIPHAEPGVDFLSNYFAAPVSTETVQEVRRTDLHL